ncbi:MAG TPA: SH3-like domain-containing protein [Streptosporangiaceae bacterium]|nr:SH3-like domain-containing protein [Streptosporangiaceae bacterium]
MTPGTRVRVRAADPDGHTRCPRYVRGHSGDVVAVLGDWMLPDAAVRGEQRVETCYSVRFRAEDLWGSGEHTVIVDMWESYLDRA